MKRGIKRILIVVLAFAMMLSFAACKSKKITTVSDGGANKADGAAEDGAQTDGGQSAAWEAGVIENNVYSGNFSGLRFVPDGEGWTYATEEEKAALYGAVPESDALSDIEKNNMELAKQSLIYEMILRNSETGSNINMVYQNLGVLPGGTAMTDEAYADTISKEFNGMIGSRYDTVSAPAKIEYAGHEYYRVDAVATAALQSARQAVLMRRIGDYVLNITFTSSSEEDIAAMLAMGQPLS